MKIFSLYLSLFALCLPNHAAESPMAVQSVQLSLRAPIQTDPSRPPRELPLLLHSTKPMYYKLELFDKIISSGRLIEGITSIGLVWTDLEKIGRVPLTLSVMDQNQINTNEFCLIFSIAPAPVDLEGNPLPAPESPATKAAGRPDMKFESHTDKRFEQLLRDIRATPAPVRPYELVDSKVYNQVSISPVNLLLYAAVYMAQKLLSRKPGPLTEINCRYSRALETGREWVSMHVSLINHPLPETRAVRH